MKRLVVMLVLPLVFFAAFAQQERFDFDDPAKRRLFQELSADLRCPKCQNQNIADSNAMVAQDLKRKTYELVREGRSKQEIIGYMKQRYGDFVYYQPPVNPVTLWLWLLPLIFIGFAVWALMRRRRQQRLSPELLNQADEWLDKEDS